MDRISFEKLVQRALRRVPRRFQQKIENLTVEVEDHPSEELLRDMGIRSGTLFGLYQGVPLTRREWNYGNVLPDRIVIYQRPIESASASPAEIEEIVLGTVMHEIGHYFGLSDKELYKLMEDTSKGRRRDAQKS